MLDRDALRDLRAEHALLKKPILRVDEHSEDSLGANPVLRARNITWEQLRAADPALYQALADWHLNLVRARTEMSSVNSRNRWARMATDAFIQIEAIITTREQIP